MAVTVWHIISGVAGAVQVSLRAVFSKYSITPARALNFGPVVYNSTAGPRTVEVTNVGEVPVNLRLFDPAKGLVCCHLTLLHMHDESPHKVWQVGPACQPDMLQLAILYHCGLAESLHAAYGFTNNAPFMLAVVTALPQLREAGKPDLALLMLFPTPKKRTDNYTQLPPSSEFFPA